MPYKKEKSRQVAEITEFSAKRRDEEGCKLIQLYYTPHLEVCQDFSPIYSIFGIFYIFFVRK